MRWLVLALVCASGCDTDVCGSFGGQTCIAVQVNGPSSLSIDQLRLSTSGAFDLTDSPSPKTPRKPVSPPIALAVLPPSGARGDFKLDVHAFRGGIELANGQGMGTLTAGKTTHVTVELLSNGVDLGGIDLRPAADLRARFDLAGADLAGIACDDITQVPCSSSQKCVLVGGRASCVPVVGSGTAGQSCNSDPDDCARGLQCSFPGNLGPADGVCEEYCASDGDCHQAAVNVGPTLEPNNKAHCLQAAPDEVCTLACNPVSTQGASGCPAGSVCTYRSNGVIPEFTSCERAGTGTDGQPCDVDFHCAPGFSCVQTTGQLCRALCRSNTNGDCTGGYVCKPGAAGAGGMFGICCPSAGC